MANHKSAIKRNRQNVRKNQRNKVAKGTLRGAVKKARAAITAGDKAAKELLQTSEKLIAKAASKGIIKKKTASRMISRLAKKLTPATK